MNGLQFKKNRHEMKLHNNFITLYRRFYYLKRNPQKKIHSMEKIVKLNEAPDVGRYVTEAATVLLRGGLVAVPTDTIYGIACLAQDTQSVQRLYRIKGRDFKKPVAICVSKTTQFPLWCQVTVPPSLLRDLLPGPVTLVFPRTPALNPELNPGHPLVGLRLPDLPLLPAIIEAVGGQPLALTSANQSGDTSCLAIQEFSSLWTNLDLILDAGRLRDNDKDRAGSTVVDLSLADSQGHFKIIRAGSALESTVSVLANKYRLKPWAEDLNRVMVNCKHS